MALGMKNDNRRDGDEVEKNFGYRKLLFTDKPKNDAMGESGFYHQARDRKTADKEKNELNFIHRQPSLLTSPRNIENRMPMVHSNEKIRKATRKLFRNWS